MKAKTSLLITAVVTLTMYIGYFMLIDMILIPQADDAPKMYQQFLLQQVPSPKVIIEAGSSAEHGLNPLILETYFKRPVVNHAMNIGYPLLHRLYNIKKYAKPGDVVILPLEWRYYGKDGAADSQYIRQVFEGWTNSFYHALPLREKLNFIFQEVSFSFVYKFFKQHFFDNKNVPHNDQMHLFYRRVNGENSDSRGMNVTNGPMPVNYYCVIIKCDQYILGNLLSSDFKISGYFMQCLSLLEKMQDAGVQIIFTWPTVVDGGGSVCYTSAVSDKLNVFVQDLRSKLTQLGFPVIGEVEDSHFSSEYFLDTYFHVIPSAADIRTRRLVHSLKEYGIRPIGETYESRKSFVDPLIEVLDLHSEEYIIGEERSIKNIISPHLYLKKGWSYLEEYFCWSDAKESMISFTLKEYSGTDLLLQFYGRPFLGNENIKKQSVQVFVNDTKTADWEMTKNACYESPIPSVLIGNDKKINIVFKINNPKSPLELGMSDDSRKLGIAIEKIVIDYSDKIKCGDLRR